MSEPTKGLLELRVKVYPTETTEGFTGQLFTKVDEVHPIYTTFKDTADEAYEALMQEGIRMGQQFSPMRKVRFEFQDDKKYWTRYFVLRAYGKTYRTE